MAGAETAVHANLARRRAAGALRLVVIGGAFVAVDFNLDPVPLVPDGVGYALLAVAGGRLASATVTAAPGGGRLTRVGVAVAVVAAIGALSWTAELVGLRPPADDEVWVWMVMAVMVWLFVALSRWCGAHGLAGSERRLRVAAHVLGWSWGALAGGVLVAVVVFDAGARVAPDSPWVVAVVVGTFATLVYAAWALLRTRADVLAHAGGRGG